MKALITDFSKWKCYIVESENDCKSEFEKQVYDLLKSRVTAGVMVGCIHAIQYPYLSQKESTYEVGKYYEI